MHYHRWYRHGSTDKVSSTKVVPPKPRNYKATKAHGHPMSDKNGKAYTHRLMLFDALKDEAISCHWCGCELDWMAPRGNKKRVDVDHLNGITDDNRSDNLVTSCHGCNIIRGQQERSERLRELGWWSRNDTVERLSNGQRRAAINKPHTEAA